MSEQDARADALAELHRAHPWSPPKAPRSSVFHYTSPVGLLGILTNGELWASEAAGLNDLDEISKGWKLAQGWLSKLPEDDQFKRAAQTALEVSDLFRDFTAPESAFVLCASEVGDDANQWRLYGAGGAGYAVELDSTVPLAVRTDLKRRRDEAIEPDEAHKRIFRRDIFRDHCSVSPWTRVVYREGLAERYLEDARAWALSRLAIAQRARQFDSSDDPSPSQEADARAYGDIESAIASVAHTLKSRGFEGENEARVVVTFTAGDWHASYRSAPVGVTRYVRLCTAPPDERQILLKGEWDKKALLPIKSVRLGPALDGRHGREAVRSLLRRCGYEDVPVKASKVRLR